LAFDVLIARIGGVGNCKSPPGSNVFGTQSGLGPLPVCGAPPPPGCPYVPPTTTTTSTSSTVTVTSTTTSTSIVPLTWTAIQGIFAGSCLPCHTGGSSQYGLGSLDDYDAGYALLYDTPSGELPSMDRVEPGNSAQSYLMHKLDGTQTTVGGFGSQMPIGGSLPTATLEGIRAWINSGAPKN
jgi:hypothetical protein